ncbi:hypothetical protein C8R41DRAFT_809379 [Lentinula lateritia]|uniref:Uncharacterized protein n=1 Tax=Lentinula lateritia TaxID=40482 RepID=A0ABQ8W060_9AGAR|nr:hypothetical protein C8R41DRAFT_809379 [Lentinula lateritia]
MLAHDASPPRPAFFNEGKGINSTKSNPSSLKSFSMKGKISFITGLLSRSSSKINIREGALGTSSDVPEENEKVDSDNLVPKNVQIEHVKPVERKNVAQSSTDRSPRATKIAKRLSTTFRKPSSQSLQHSPRVPVPSAHSRQMREAALRERGLLPPKDMSALEREQDNLLPLSPIPQAAYADGPSEADRIKQAWEAKIQSNDPTDFKSVTSKIIDQPPKSDSFNESLDLRAVREVSTPPSSPKPPSSIRKSSSRAHLAQPKAPPTCDLPPTPVDPESIPLPPSPLEDTFNSAEILFRETSPLSSSSANSPHISPDAVSLHLSSAPSGLSPTPPRALLPLPPSTGEHSEDGAQAPSKSRSDSRPSRPSVVINSCSDSDESGSIASPSLDTSSQLTSESPLSHVVHKVKPVPLVKTWAKELSVPVIVESPIEGHTLVHSIDDSTINDIPEEETNHTGSPLLRVDPHSPNEKRKPLLDKRSTLSPKISSDKQAGGKMSRSNSLANFRQSVVSTLSRKPSSFKKPTSFNFDGSSLPPSPTVPASLAGQSTNSSMSTQSVKSKNSLSHSVPIPVPRQALSPKIHSRGSILLEASHIEDEETRRMTEMAFMG